MDRDTSWKTVWNDRDDERADWNGYESCFASPEEYPAWVERVSGFISSTLALSPSDHVADLGCGTGRFAAHIADVAGSVIALDYSRPAIDVARDRRQAPNITYKVADLNTLDPSTLEGCTKAYAVGSFMYLTTVDYVFEMVHSLIARGISVLAMDLPDAALADDRERGYDRAHYSHLAFTAEQFDEAFPGSRIFRGMFPGYVNDALRFSVLLAAE